MHRLIAVALLAACSLAVGVEAGEWTYWRGPDLDGVSPDKGLPESWTPDGENMIWKARIVARSTPVVFDGRACVNGRVGEGVERQERVACFDAENGKLLWEDRLDVYNTTVPFNRVGWASLVGDPESGFIYAHGVAGQLNAYDRKGKLVWSHFLGETQGRASGYGGRTQTPIVDGDQLILSAVFVGWGQKAAPRHRIYSFDKHSGEINWVSTPGGRVFDMNTQSAPVIATIGGQRLLIQGHADGHIHAVQAATGVPVWKFQLSKRGINSTVLVDGDIVYASHSEENIDDPTMGRVVAIDGTGKGDVTATHEKWRINELAIGFPSPTLKDGVLYAIDNSANLLALDIETGEERWSHSVGTVGKASPVIADGKIYITETNGNIHILKLKDDGTVETLDHDEVNVPDEDRYAEIYGSPAIAYGRLYVATEGWLYCIGDKSKKIDVAAHRAPKAPRAEKGTGEPVHLIVSPTEFLLAPGETQKLRVRAYDAKGRLLGERSAEWSVEGLEATITAGGKLTASDEKVASAGSITAKVGGLSASAVARIVPPLPWSIDFDDHAIDSVPVTWIAAPGKYKVEEKDGNKVLTKFVRPKGLLRNALYMGPSDWTNYTIEADLMGNNKKRRKADIGLIAAGYTLDLQGSKQAIQIRSWASEERMAQSVDFPWEMNVWYRAKLRVENDGKTGRILGKVWKKGEPEPAEWTITVEDPLPIDGGSPGLQGYSPADIWFDNIKVTEN